MIHYFDVKIACDYGVNKAIILQNIHFWSCQNKANGINYFDGRTWTFNSVKAYKVLFPYLSEKQIRTTLDQLCDDDILLKGCYNKSPYDKTNWYALSDNGARLFLQDDVFFTQNSQALTQNVPFALQGKSNSPKGRTDYDKRANLYQIINTDEKPDNIVCAPFDKFIESYNNLKLQNIKATNARKKLFDNLVKNYGENVVFSVFEKIKKSDYLKGSKGWKITIDWLMKPNNFIKVIEGNYNDNENTSRKTSFDINDFHLLNAVEL